MVIGDPGPPGPPVPLHVVWEALKENELAQILRPHIMGSYAKLLTRT